MTPSTVTQIFNNVPALAQQGYDPVAQASVNFSGGDALLGFSGSAWSQTTGQISLQVWLDGEPVGGQLSIYANAGAMHMSLGRTWVHCPGVTAGTHQVMVVAGPTTITDQNDRVSLTLWELGDGVVVRTVTDTPCPTGTGKVLATDVVGLEAGALMLSASTSGWVTQAATLVGAPMLFDKGDALISQVFANNANQHLATVPVDLVYSSSQRGQHRISLNAMSNTSTDSGDYAHLAMLEWVNPPDAPVVLNMNPYLQDAVTQTQQGGDYVIQSRFQSSGGTLLFRVNLSAWSYKPNTLMDVSIQVDGKPLANTSLFANPSATHLTLVSNDLVLTGIPAGNHVFALQAALYTFTDVNDRVSVQALEFPKAH
jgi:hypothetical protein